MRQFPLQQQRLLPGTIAWYLAGGLSDDEAMGFASGSDGIVVRGPRGYQQAARLRDAGWEGQLLCDLAAYERPRPGEYVRSWAEHQRAIDVSEVLSPGFYADPSQLALRAALVEGARWIDTNQGDRVLLALDSRWLTAQLNEFIEELSLCPRKGGARARPPE